jgi:hypothetical protein
MRRLRRAREIPFSFDSFLDVVANVVGIIIRLILVVWVGARSYSSLQHVINRPESRHSETGKPSPLPHDPLEDELARRRAELAQAQARLLDQLRQLQQVKDERAAIDNRRTDLVAREGDLERVKKGLDETATAQARASETVALSLAELKRRQQKLLDDIRALEQLPPVQHVLRYQTPVSRPVHTEEFMFECREGRVSFIDLAALQAEVRRELDEKGPLLKTRWQVSDVTHAVGPFRLRYTLERERGLMEAVIPGSAPEAGSGFRYGLSEWVVEPLSPVRGEPLARALAKNSDFRQLVDALDPQQAVVTFWVYPDSFDLYRRLRDYLYQRDLVVAGRPLPPDASIACSRHGTLSRGQ